jgi:hypothetical protein
MRPVGLGPFRRCSTTPDPGGDISMTADKVKHSACRKRMTRRQVRRDSTQMVEAAVKTENNEIPF